MVRACQAGESCKQKKCVCTHMCEREQSCEWVGWIFRVRGNRAVTMGMPDWIQFMTGLKCETKLAFSLAVKEPPKGRFVWGLVLNEGMRLARRYFRTGNARCGT